MTPLEKVLSATASLGPQEPQSDNSWMVVCPAHEDSNPSLHVTPDHAGKIALHCFKGCDAKAICHAMAMTVSELFPDYGQAKPSGSGGSRPLGGKKAKNRQQQRKQGGFKKFAEYEYRDADKVVIYKAIEYRNEAGKKDFTQCRPNGAGGWIENMRGVDRVPYCLPELIESPKDQIVFLVEGEKKVNALRKWGLTATCNVGGAGKWLADYSKYLRGRDVVILPDNDPIDTVSGACPGMDHARKVIACNDGIAKSTRILILPDLPVKGDVVDWIAAGGTKCEFERLVSKLMQETSNAAANANSLSKQPDPTAVAKLTSSEFEEKLLSDIHLEVLGEIADSGGKVKVFSEDHRKTDVISDLGRLSYERLLQICGPAVKKSVHQGSEDIPGIYTLKDVKQAVAVVSGFRRVGNESEHGRGIWRGRNENHDPCNSIVLVGAGEAARWNGDGIFHRIQKPRSDGLLLDFGDPKPWYTHNKLGDLIKAASDRQFCRAAYERTHEIFSRWEWKNGISPHLITCLVMATFIQTLWAWRPQIVIIGETNAGKSLLFEALSKIFGPICMKSSASSAAGLRQAIKCSGVVVLCDEIDSNKERQSIFDMIRLSSRGDSVLKGTTSHKGQEFSLRHIVWLTGIESGLEQEPDKNRFITLELIPPPAERMGQLRVPPDAELSELGQQLLAIAIRHGIAAVDMARELKRERFESCNQRVVESYSPLAAMNVAACGESTEGGFGTRREVLEMLLNLTEEPKEFDQDKNRLLLFIFSSVIEIGHGQKETVARTIKRRLISSDYPEALERNGIKLNEDASLIFLAHNEIKRKLLRGSDWEKKNVGEILERIDGATSKILRIAGVLHRGFLIPSNHKLIGGVDAEE